MIVDPLAPEGPRQLGRTTFQVRIAPRRRALLVQEDDVEQLRTALFATAALWGGARNPILPVDQDGKVPSAFLQIAELLDVTEIVDFTSNRLGESAWIQRDNSSPLPVTHARPLSDASFWNAHPLVVTYDDRIRELHLPKTSSLSSLAGAGGYGLDEEVRLFRDAGFNVIERCSPELLAIAQLDERTALGATLPFDADTSIHGGMLASVGLLWIAEQEDSFHDAVWFWNARALRPRYRVPRPISVLTSREIAGSAGFQRQFVEGVVRTATTTPSFIIASGTVSDADLRKIAESIGAKQHTDSKFSEALGRQPGNAGTISYTVNVDPRQFWAAPRSNGSPVSVVAQLERPSINLYAQTPVEWVPKYVLSGKVTATIASSAIAGPPSAAVARLFHPNAKWSSDGALRLITNNVPDYSWMINLPEPTEVLRAVVEERGYDYRLSDKGQQIRGALAGQDGFEFYRSRAAVLAIRLLTAKPGRDLARELKRLSARDDLSQRSVDDLRAASLLGHRPPRTLSELRSQAAQSGIVASHVSQAMEELVARGAATMGLVTACALCSLTEFQPLATIEGRARCRGCGANARFKLDPGGAPEIHFALTSLIHTLSLNGGLAPLAATALLAAEGYYVEPGVNLYSQGSLVGEMDLFGWTGSTCLAGEAKSSLDGFIKADVARDTERARRIGADTYVAVCLEAMSDEVRAELLAACTKSDLELRVLDEDELLLDGEVHAAPSA